LDIDSLQGIDKKQIVDTALNPYDEIQGGALDKKLMQGNSEQQLTGSGG
jgi:hypothetical protein